MRRLWLFSFFERFFALWVGIVFCGVCSVRAQERPIDTVHLFNAHADTIRLGFDDTLHISANDKDYTPYAYRWNINSQEAGEENVLDFFFTGQRKNKITGSRVISARAYHFDITPTPSEDYYYFVQDATDTVYLEAFPDYANDPDASWLWIVDEDTLSDTGPQIRLTATYGTQVDCYFQMGNEEYLHTMAVIRWFYGETGISIYLPENEDGHSHHLYVFSQDFDRIYAHPNDTLCLDAWAPDEFLSNTSFTRPTIWYSSTLTEEELDDRFTSSKIVFFRGTRDRDYLLAFRWIHLYDTIQDMVYDTVVGQWRDFFIHWGNAEIETDSVWVFFPQYPYSNLGGRVDVCLPPDAPLPSAEDTVYTFNLGPWNRELEYVEYAWFDGTKTASGADSVVGTDSVFAYLFGRMDSVSPELYAGTLVTRVASDSLWQDTCSCYIPCTDAACSGYDTVQIFLHLLPSLRENVFLPRDSVLCAHLDLDLQLPPAAEAYRVFGLIKTV